MLEDATFPDLHFEPLLMGRRIGSEFRACAGAGTLVFATRQFLRCRCLGVHVDAEMLLVRGGHRRRANRRAQRIELVDIDVDTNIVMAFRMLDPIDRTRAFQLLLSDFLGLADTFFGRGRALPFHHLEALIVLPVDETIAFFV